MAVLLHSSSSKQQQNQELSRLLSMLQQKKKMVSCWAPLVFIPFVVLNTWFLYSYYISDGSSASHSSAMPPLPVIEQQTPQKQLSKIHSDSCDLLHGRWIPDDAPPQFTNATCKHIQPFQNCMKNGKPNAGYLNWRWKPEKCELPRFDGNVFLELVTNKRLLFFGDSLARNHMQSLLCSLSQVEEPEKLHTRLDRDVIWLFRTYNFTLTILWAPFLVKHVQAEEEKMLFDLHLDKPHSAWFSSISSYDFAIFSASQWFFRPSMYFLNDTLIGCNHYAPGNCTRIEYVHALKLAAATALASIEKSGFRGTAIFRTVSTEHFENGTWSTRGTCLRKVPFTDDGMELGWMPQTFNSLQVEEFEKASERLAAREHTRFKLRLWDVTRAMFMRPDGHPGPYRLFDPFPNGDQSKHVQNDCLHWCLPGPIDMWNQLLLEDIKQDNAEKEHHLFLVQLLPEKKASHRKCK